MIYNSVSVKQILSKLYRDLKPNNTSWESDAIEWIGEALSFIGVTHGFVEKVVELKVKDNRTPLPADFYTLKAVYYEDTLLPYGRPSAKGHDIDEAIYIAPKDQVLEHSNFQMTRYGSRLYKNINPDGEYYTIVPGYIQTSFEKGTIHIVYDGWDVDEDGFPMIPDSPFYSSAIQWYIIRQMMLGGYKHPVPDFTFQYVDAKWEQDCLRAQNDGMYPSEDRVRRFNEMWVNLMPTISHNFNKK